MFWGLKDQYILKKHNMLCLDVGSIYENVRHLCFSSIGIEQVFAVQAHLLIYK